MSENNIHFVGFHLTPEYNYDPEVSTRAKHDPGH